MAAKIRDTKCPVCNFPVAMKRLTGLDECMRFDPDENIEDMLFVRERESRGRAGGFVTLGGYTIEEVLKMPGGRKLVDRLHARITRVKAYLDEVNP